jgi:hypothetical protein
MPKGRAIFWGGLAGLSLVALAAFTLLIGGGRLTGPGICLALSVLALGVSVDLLVKAARALTTAPPRDEEEQAVGRRRKELEREYQALKRALKELELDHAMGKLSERDYGEIRGRYRERAVRILKQLDQGESYRRQIEEDLKARRLARGEQRPGEPVS